MKRIYFKKVISIILTLCMLIPYVSSIEVKGATIFEQNYLKFEVITEPQGGENGTVNVSGNNTGATSIIIPETVTNNGKTYNVTEIKDAQNPKVSESFNLYTELVSIEIPDSITSIGNYAFAYCTKLTSIKLPDSITSIGEGAFTGCSSLANINLPSSIISINSNTFSDCSSLKSINIPDTVTTINGYAFAFCSSLVSAKISTSTTSIGSGAFTGCSNLTSINLPASVSSINTVAFKNCTSLKDITILSNELETLANNSFSNINENAKFYIVSEDIKNLLISKCKISADKIEMIDAPKSYSLKLNSNGSGTVSGDGIYKEGEKVTIKAIPNDGHKFDNWTVNSDNVTLEDRTLAEIIFTMPDADVKITANFSELAIDNVFSQGNLKFEVISKPSSISNGKVRVSGNDKSAISIEIPKTVTNDKSNYDVIEIKGSAFDDYRSLTNIEIPDSITYIGDSAFMSCDKLTNIKTPNSVTYIGSHAFAGCYRLISVEMSNSITSISKDIFYKCTSLTNIKIPNSVTVIEDYAFIACFGLTDIEIPKSVTSIGNGVFSDCSNLESITILSEHLEDIHSTTFSNLNDKTKFYIVNENIKNLLINICEISADRIKIIDASKLHTLKLNSDDNGVVYGNGKYAEGKTVTITAKAKDGYKFDSWTVNSGDVTLENSNSSQTTFIMPANDVEITANFVGNNEIVETPNKDLIFNIITKPEGETNGTVSVTAANKDLTSVYIPETIKDKDGNTYTVVEIEDNAFKDCSNLQHIKLPNTIINIGQGAFENCTNLIEITIPSDVTSIGDNAFKGCIILQIVVIISVNITIGKDAFTNVADNIIYITTNNDTKDKLKPFVKDENQIQVSDGNVKDTSSVIIRTSTGGTATGNGLYKSGDTVNLKATAKDGYKFDKWIVISGNITIENINSENTSFTMPDKNVILMANFVSNSGNSDNNVGDSFVTDDKFIVTVTKPAGSDTQGTVTIVGTTDTSDTITIPSTITDKNGKVYKITFVSDNAFTGNKNITSVIIQNGITSIGNGAFKDCVNLIHISIPDSVTSIGDSAFENCAKLEKIEIPSSVILIGNNAFKGCINLSKIIILTIKVIIKNNAFENISKDASFIVINQEIKNILIQIGIAENQIVISKGLHKVTVKSNGNGVVAGSGTYSKDDTVTIKATPNEKYKFDKWTVNAGNVTLAEDKLAETTFTMPDEDVEITASFAKDEIVIESKDNLDFIVQKPATENEEGEVTFKVIDKNVTSVTIPSKVKDNKGNSYVIKIIPNNAFEGCTNLKEITIPETIISIGDSAFKGCISLIKIILPDTITVIGSNAFEGCTSLIEITIPKNVELIKDNAFLNCTSLIKVIILSLNLQIATSAFTGMSSNTIFIVLNQEVKAILILCHILEIQIIILDPESNLQEQINKANELLRKSYPTLDEVIQSTMDLSDGIIYYFQSK